MAGGSVSVQTETLRLPHFVTVWESLTAMTKSFMTPDEWEIQCQVARTARISRRSSSTTFPGMVVLLSEDRPDPAA